MAGEDNISKIKDRLDVAEVVGSYIKLAKSGVNFKAKCPFHNEKTPSFFVSPEKQIWHCFSCGTGGDIFGFVKEIEGVEFPEALRILAARAGVELGRYSSEGGPASVGQNAKSRLYDVTELAVQFFEKQLSSSLMGGKVSKYLSERGVADASIKTFRLGYAPDSWEALGDFLRSRKFSEQDIISAGLAVKKDSASESASRRNSYDRFRKRIMFPIFDMNGSAVGFAGRIFSSSAEASEDKGDVAKYVNTPQTEIYDKSRLLYGLNFAKLDIRRANKCVVVEGNMDVIMSHQAGLANTVASSGTALTDGHLRIIKRYTENIDLCFDADSAGSTATDRGVDLALAHGFNVGVISVNEPEVKDPADFVARHGAEWKEYAEKNSQPFLDFYFSRFKKTTDLATALGKKTMSQKILPLIASIPNAIEREHWVQELAFALHVHEDIVRAELASAPSIAKAAAATDLPRAAVPLNPLSMYEENMLALALRRPPLYDSLIANKHLFSDGFNDSIAALATHQSDAPYPMVLQFAQLKADEVWKEFDDDEIDKEFEKLLNQIKKRTIAKQLEHLGFTIKEAEHNKDKEGMNVLLTQFSKLSKELISL